MGEDTSLAPRMAPSIALALALLAAADARAQPEPLPHVEVVTGGARADDELPLIVALHGRGDTPERFAPAVRRSSVRARVAILRPPHRWGPGLAWFTRSRARAETRRIVAAELLALADRVAATAAEIARARPTRGRPLLVGFSQGAMLAYATAVRRPESFAAVFPIAGFFFPEWAEHVDAADMPPIEAFHGTADDLVSIDDDRRGVRTLEARGARIVLHEYAGAPHAITLAMHTDLDAALARALEGSLSSP
jgi:phospholipase/carboxylesterase